MFKPYLWLTMPDDSPVQEMYGEHETVGEAIELLRKHYPAAVVDKQVVTDNVAFYSFYKDRIDFRAGKDRAAGSGFGEYLKEVMPEGATVTLSSGKVGQAIMPPENAAEFEAAFADN